MLKNFLFLEPVPKATTRTTEPSWSRTGATRPEPEKSDPGRPMKFLCSEANGSKRFSRTSRTSVHTGELRILVVNELSLSGLRGSIETESTELLVKGQKVPNHLTRGGF